ncbi:MAG TPA: DMT family transporter [Pseudonocardiaceae bacterium]
MTTPVRPHSVRLAVASGALAACIVGGSVPVTGMLAGYPVLSGQAVRYAIGAIALYGWLRYLGRRLPRPGWRDVVGMAGMVAFGMLGFNAALLAAQRYAEPGFVAAMLGGTPLFLAIVVPALRGRRPALAALAGAVVVVSGVLVLSGGGSWHGPGLLLSVLVLLGEVMFTVSGAGVTRRLGVVEASTWASAAAAVIGAGISSVVSGPAAWPMPSERQWVALAVLGVLVTAVAFVGWYSAVAALGADRAGVLIGLMPVAGFVMSVLLGAQPVSVTGIGGALLVGLGCVAGLRRATGRRGPSGAHPARSPAVPG